jgi:hypothetical protein
METSRVRRKTKRRSRRRLLVGFLEDVSGNVLADDPKIIKGMLRRRTGVYALYRRETLYYVGLASNLIWRLRTHLKDRHKGLWDRFNIYLTRSDEHMRELESLVLRIVRPKGNRVSGKLSGATDFKYALNREMARRDAARRARDLGGYVARRLRRSRTKDGHGSLVLAGLFERRMPLRAKWRNETFHATLRKDGLISFRRKSYRSPTAAARAVVGRTVNGWTFWQYRGPNREWERLARLRR